MKTIATMATYHPRILSVVWNAVESLADQVDEIHLNINPPIDDLMRWRIDQQVQRISERHSAQIRVGWMKHDIGDLAKFAPLVCGEFQNDDVILICDDDIIYPADYVYRMRIRLATINNKANFYVKKKQAIASLGGKVMGAGPYESFRGSWAERIGFFENAKEFKIIDIPLTGGVAMYGRALDKGLYIDERFRNKGDIMLASWARAHGHFIWSVPKDEAWCKYNPLMTMGVQTIWSDMVHNPHTERDIATLLNEVFYNDKTEKV